MREETYPGMIMTTEEQGGKRISQIFKQQFSLILENKKTRAMTTLKNGNHGAEKKESKVNSGSKMSSMKSECSAGE